MHPALPGTRSPNAIGAGRLAHLALEPAVEGRQIVEAGVEGDRRDRFVRRAQPHRRPMKPGPQQELMGRHASDMPERAQEMKRAGRRAIGKLGQR